MHDVSCVCSSQNCWKMFECYCRQCSQNGSSVYGLELPTVNLMKFKLSLHCKQAVMPQKVIVYGLTFKSSSGLTVIASWTLWTGRGKYMTTLCFEPHMIDLPPAPNALLQIMRCRGKTHCASRCSRKKCGLLRSLLQLLLQLSRCHLSNSPAILLEETSKSTSVRETHAELELCYIWFIFLSILSILLRTRNYYFLIIWKLRNEILIIFFFYANHQLMRAPKESWYLPAWPVLLLPWATCFIPEEWWSVLNSGVYGIYCILLVPEAMIYLFAIKNIRWLFVAFFVLFSPGMTFFFNVYDYLSLWKDMTRWGFF